MSIESVMPSNHLFFCHPLLLLPSIFPSIRVFSSESVPRIRWPKYRSFIFSISPSNEYLGLISFRMDWLDLPAVQRLSRVFQKSSSKSSKPGFNSTQTVNFQMFKLDLEKAEEPEIKLSTSVISLKKQESSRKTSTSALLTTPKPWTVWIITNSGKLFKRWEYYTTWPASWEICMQVKEQQLALDMKQTGSK